MAKTTRKTEPTGTEKKPAARRTRTADPADGVAKATTPRRTKAAAAVSAAAQTIAGTPGAEPTHDEIALRAWSIYLQRGGSHGQAMSDWLQAKAELVAERGLKP
jgi:hypothetical protein